MCSLCSDLDVSLCCEWWILSNDKILTYWHDVEFILPFVDVGYCIDWFVTSETSLRPWNKFHAIVVCDPFGKLLDLVCWCFVEDVHSYLSEVICNSVFAWFCFPCPGGFIGCTWEGSILFSVLEEFEKDGYPCFFMCLVKFSCDAAWSWACVWWEFSTL